jgi:fumarylpyruvate hydrolase
MTINNIYCVGRNYALHAAELGNKVPEAPMIFMKPTHALVPMDGRTIRLPANRGAIHYEAEIILRISADYVSDQPPERWIDAFAIGLDLTLRDVQSNLKAQGYPWLPAKGFLNSAPIGVWQPFQGLESMVHTPFSLTINGEQRQQGTASEMIFSIEKLAKYIAEHYGLGRGDLIFTGTPAGVGALSDDDLLSVLWNKQNAGSIRIHMET